METLYFQQISKLKKSKAELEKKLHVEIHIEGRKVSLSGSPPDEYEARLVVDALNMGFPIKKALLLKHDNVVFHTLSIKHFTRRKNLAEVRARIIGTQGRTKHTIEELSGCAIILKDNMLALIGPAASLDTTVTALTNLIRGSKQANVYHFLERMNTHKKSLDTDLGLKEEHVPTKKKKQLQQRLNNIFYSHL